MVTIPKQRLSPDGFWGFGQVKPGQSLNKRSSDHSGDARQSADSSQQRVGRLALGRLNMRPSALLSSLLAWQGRHNEQGRLARLTPQALKDVGLTRDDRGRLARLLD